MVTRGEQLIGDSVPVDSAAGSFLAEEVDDGPQVVVRRLPGVPIAQARERLTADVRWSNFLGEAIALQPVDAASQSPSERLLLQADGFRPLSDQRGTILPVSAALGLGMAIASALARCHARGIVHGALSPATIWLGAGGEEVRLAALDACFSDQGAVHRELPWEYPIDLRYAAPERSTRGSPIDRCADLYSIGVILYELVAGRLPFDDTDSVAMHHAHSAIAPTPLRTWRPEAPLALADMIAALLEKDPVRRYQSAIGVHMDLRRIAEAYAAGSDASIGRLSVDLRDLPRRPTRLVGRADEADMLAECLAEGATPAIHLVEGPSGCGKSSLVRRALAQPNAPTLVGFNECDRPQRHMPLAALTGALRSLLAEIEHGDDATRAALRDRGGELQAYAAPLLRLLPALAPYLQPSQAPVPDLSAAAAEQRIHLALLDLMTALSKLPVRACLVLDEFQWADPTTVSFLRFLVATTNSPPISIVLVRRDDEARSEPIDELMGSLHESAAHGRVVRLEHLDERATVELVADCLDCDAQSIAELGHAVYAHTEGSPLSVVEALPELTRSEILARDLDGVWQWDADALEATPRFDSLPALLHDRLRRLPEQERSLLQHAACFGSRFDPNAVTALGGMDEAAATERLQSLCAAGLLVELGEDVDGRRLLRFAHDQVEVAAYGLFDDHERERIHAAIADRILTEGAADAVLQAIGHCNAAAPLYVGQGRAVWLAERNLEAARAAISRSAFNEAWSYLNRALDLLPADSWTTHYDLTRDIHQEAALAACVNNAAERALHFTAALRGHARRVVETVAAAELEIDVLKVLDRFDAVLESGLGALEVLGFGLSRRQSIAAVVAAILATQTRITRRGPEGLEQLPVMTEEHALGAMRIMGRLNAVAFLVDRNLFASLVGLQVRLSLRFGNAPESANAYALYAVILAGPLQRFAQAGRIATSALRLGAGVGGRYAASTSMAANVFVMPWVRPLPQCLPAYEAGYRESLEAGDPEFANYLASAYGAFGVHAGPDLAAIIGELETMRERIQQFGQQRQYAGDIYHQLCLNLITTTGDPVALAGPIYDESEHGPSHGDAAEMNGHRYLAALVLRVLFGRPEGLAEVLSGLRASAEPFTGMYISSAFVFYESVALLRYQPNAVAFARATRAIVRLRRWARHAPDNFAHKVRFLHAELAATVGQWQMALRLYDEAASMAERAGFLLEAGLALEAARDVAQRMGAATLVRHYLEEARRVYGSWGARAKLRDLEVRFGTDEQSRPAREFASSSVAPTDLDLLAVVGASQRLSTGIDLPSTLRLVIETVVTLSGAQRGLLIEVEGDRLQLPVHARIESGALQVRLASEGNDSEVQATTLPSSVIESARALRSVVTLGDPADDPRFAGDPYFASHRPRSILCLPVFAENDERILLYLEHDLRPDAFGAEQVESVRLIARQAAISLRNARLYDRQVRLRAAAQRFVPREFLGLLGKTDVDEVELSDWVEAEMTIMFCDIRGFTTTTERMTPDESFRYINHFFALVGSLIRDHAGFVLKYTGDGLMAVFPASADDALSAARAMISRLAADERFGVGIGLHTGTVAVGAVGEEDRIQADLISDVANVASRLETLTRKHDTDIVLSERTRSALSRPDADRFRPLGALTLKGRSEPVVAFATDADPTSET